MMNSALNALAARGRPDFRLLSARYGERFKDHDQQLIQARPAGLLGSIRLVTTIKD
ncbi:hypothetical protein [Sphingobium yanoikuyae]|uniref:hypothetical protein n=1 Tax=Sphingobium yanoikuyae TaxID=13690 RepID=UPI0014785573|nr:hypothetical protein [Sphingobium yanoikuyae]